MPADGLMRVLAAIPLAPGAEVTVECNPDTVTGALLDTYRLGGVNRLSFGVQSMVPHVLAALGRTHDPEAVARAVGLARRAGFDDLNLDLIYGGAGESLDDWRITLERRARARARPRRARTPSPSSPARRWPTTRRAIPTTTTRPTSTSWPPSGWARPVSTGTRSPTGPGPATSAATTSCTGSQGDYLGVGCAAHSHRGGRRWWNVRTPERYIELVGSGRSTESAGETLSDATRHIEGLQLALRTSEGVPAEALPLDAGELDGLVEVEAGRARLTVAGRLLANEVSVRLR